MSRRQKFHIGCAFARRRRPHGQRPAGAAGREGMVVVTTASPWCVVLTLALLTLSGCQRDTSVPPTSAESGVSVAASSDAQGTSPVAEQRAASERVDEARPSSVTTADHEPATAAADVELDPAKQDAIWDAEHITFEIEKCVGPRFWKAVKSADAIQFRDVLRADFTGRFSAVDSETGESSFGAVRFRRLQQHSDAAAMTADEFAGHASHELMAVSGHQSTKFRVLAINRDPSSKETWRCRIYLASNGASADGSLVHYSSENDVTFRFADESALHAEPVIATWEFLTGSVESVQRPLFRENTDSTGLQNSGIEDNWNLPPAQVVQYRFQLAVEDFDGDGWLDIAVAENHQSRLFQWQPRLERFHQVGQKFGIPSIHGKSGSGNSLAGFFDMDNDGDPDLVLGNRLYRNESGAQFTDITDKSGLRFLKKAMGVHFADFDVDGLLDMYVLYQGSRERTGNESPLSWVSDDNAGEDSQLWRNIGHGKFRNVTVPRKASGGRKHTLAAAVFHYDDDHLPDLYLANDFSENNLLKNSSSGVFEDVALASGTSDYATSMGVAAGDIDNDGRSDLYVANMFSKMGRRIIGHVEASDYPPGIFPLIQGSCAGNRLYRRTTSNERFDEFGEQLGIHDVGWAYAPAMADFNNDGLLDLYATTGFLSFQRGEPDG